MSTERMLSVVVFDGVCVLCNGWVRFLLARDPQRRFRFAAMQTPAGRALLERHGLDPDAPASFLFLDEAGAGWTDAAAIVQVLRRMPALWPLAARVFDWLPRRVCDRAYRLIARHRYRWFGRHARCLLPPSNARDRFIG
jgi:predicted DCC family thiol-disulfide oxidoreductase YuxK